MLNKTVLNFGYSVKICDIDRIKNLDQPDGLLAWYIYGNNR